MEEETATEKPTKSRSVLATFKGIAFTLLVLSALWFAVRYVLPPLVLGKTPPVAATVSAPQDDARIKALEERLAALEMAPPAAPPAVVDIAPIEARLTTLEQAASAPASMASNEELIAIKDTIAQIKTDNHNAIRRIILTTQLAEAIRSGRPFAGELAALVALAPEMKETLAPLAANAATGIATLAALQTQFSTTLNGALSTATKEKTFARSFKALVKIRKSGEGHKGKDDEAIIARAEAKLGKGDVAASSQEIASLSPASASHFEGWQVRAKDYLVAMHMLFILSEAQAESKDLSPPQQDPSATLGIKVSE